MPTLSPVAVNLAGFLESPQFGGTPFAVDVDGRPFVPVGDGGIVLGVELGERVFDFDGDHAAPGATLMHPDQAARHGLTSFACLGNEVVLRSGKAAGQRGRVLGKRGEAGRVIVVFEQAVLSELGPGDAVMVRGFGQGFVPAGAPDVLVLNTDPVMLERLGIGLADGVDVDVRAAVPSKLIGNGLGRPAQQWDLDLSVTAESAGDWGLSGLRFGDLVAITDLDVRHNAGFRSGWVTVGVVVHGASRLPGHGPGVMPMLCGPREQVSYAVNGQRHSGVTYDRLGF